jgi:hypothetical protein
MFTFSTFRSNNRDRIRINDSNLRVTTLAVIAAISEEHGLIDYVVHPKAINSEVFVAFINQIAEKLGGGDFALFLDNLSVHKTKDAKHLFEKLNITEIFGWGLPFHILTIPGAPISCAWGSHFICLGLPFHI